MRETTRSAPATSAAVAGSLAISSMRAPKTALIGLGPVRIRTDQVRGSCKTARQSS